MNHTRGERLRAAAAVAACSLALAACGGDPEEKPDRGAETSPGPTADSGTRELVGGPSPEESEAIPPDNGLPAGPEEAAEVTILDHGASPRMDASLDLTEGQRSVTTMEMTMTMSFDGRATPSIPISMATAVEVVDVTDDLITVRSTYEDVSVNQDGLPRELVEELESGLAALEGLAITTDQAPSGALLDTRFSLPDNAPPAAHQMVEQVAASVASYSVPFPSEPVGEGASWQVVDTLETSGVTLSQTTTYVLEELDGERYRISVELDGTFEPMDLGGGLELVSGSVAGGGQTAGALGQLMPTSGTSEFSTTMVMQKGRRNAETSTLIAMSITTEFD